ncbi:MAG: hypothetical protein IKM33_05010 [Clostridia bacterium]|nr:hypothetical protein [Clostridia bacterium]
MLGWILLLAGSVACFFILEMLVFPKCFLGSEYSIGQTSDRGIRKYKTATDGMYFLYEPNWFVRQFIKQYVIAVADERKTLTCKLDEGIDYLRYDVVLFDTSDRVFKILNVQQLVEDSLYTDEIELPPETAYVTLELNQVNRRIFPKAARARVSARKLVFYGLATCATAMVTAFCMNLSFAHLFGKVFRESYAASMAENVAVLSVALAAAAVGTVALSLAILLKNKKK